MIQITHKITGSVLFEVEAAGIKAALEVAVSQGANLARANLDGANLAGANLARANLDGANLAGANLAGAYLARANLDGANLDGANLAGANLAGAYLAGAYLAGANLDGAYLAGAYLAGANLARAYLDGANLAGANLAGAYLAGASYGEEVPLTKTPVQILGLTWPVLIFDTHIKIGCQIHRTDKWREFDDDRIVEMDGRSALKFWRAYKTMIMTAADAHQDS